MMIDRCTPVLISDVSNPPRQRGTFEVYVNHFWVITDKDEILLFEGRSPQCNHAECNMVYMRDRHYPGLDVREIPIVYLDHKCEA